MNMTHCFESHFDQWKKLSRATQAQKSIRREKDNHAIQRLKEIVDRFSTFSVKLLLYKIVSHI